MVVIIIASTSLVVLGVGLWQHTYTAGQIKDELSWLVSDEDDDSSSSAS